MHIVYINNELRILLLTEALIVDISAVRIRIIRSVENHIKWPWATDISPMKADG